MIETHLPLDLDNRSPYPKMLKLYQEPEEKPPHLGHTFYILE